MLKPAKVSHVLKHAMYNLPSQTKVTGHVSFGNSSIRYSDGDTHSRSFAGLPDGIFSNQKSRFG
jgi:hypothetical protein